MTDKYTWEAQYNDGSIVKQIEADGTKNGYDDLKRDGLALFTLVDADTNEKKLVIIFDNDGEKLVWTRRRYFIDTIEQNPIYIVGKKGEFIHAVTYDGLVISRHNFHQDGIFDEVIQ